MSVLLERATNQVLKCLFVMLLIIVGSWTVARADSITKPGAMSGTVVDQQQHPISGAVVFLSGPSTVSATTDSKGVFNFANLTPGQFSLTVSKASFITLIDRDVPVTAGQTTNLVLDMQPATFGSLGRVTVTARSGLNVSPASTNYVSAQVIHSQNEIQIQHILAQIPGVSVSVPGIFGTPGDAGALGSNQASQGTPAVPQLRGALAYETASLIDGHPMSVGRFGYYNATFLNSYLLNGIDVIKGPGAMAPNINYAIGGTANYASLEPTRARQQSIDLGVDGYGGLFTNVRATGADPNGKLGYAFDYVVTGTPGPLHNYPVFNDEGLVNFGFGVFINGKPAQSSCNFGLPTPPQYQVAFVYTCNNVNVGLPMNTNYLQKAGLLKLRYSLSSSTSLTASYIGSYVNFSSQGTAAFLNTFSSFTPPTGYTGPTFPNAANLCCISGGDPNNTMNVSGIFQTELRTALHNDTILARYYRAGTYNDLLNPDSLTANVKLYGEIGLGSPPVPTIFNGQTVTMFTPGTYFETLDRTTELGYSVEYDHPVAENLYSISYDESRNTSFSFQGNFPSSLSITLVPAGSGQIFRTVMARGVFALEPKFNLTLSNYYITYTNHFSDNGTTFQNVTHYFDGPRIGFSWQPYNRISWRAAAGSSIAPPYIFLISNQVGPPVPNNFPPSYYTVNRNSGDVLPETAFGYDIGSDLRLGNSSDTILRLDAYQTTLHNQYLPVTELIGTYSNLVDQLGDPTPRPLYANFTANLGHSRYQGVEMALTKTPGRGFGYIVEGALQRAFPFDVPPSLYRTPSGPLTTNLAVIPNINFQPSGFGYNGISTSRIPYSQGYAEANYRTFPGAFYTVGVTYFGSNNSFNEPAFATLRASIGMPLTKTTSVLLSGDNLTAAYNKPYYGSDNGIPVPLINGKLGVVEALNVGPTTYRFTLHQSI